VDQIEERATIDKVCIAAERHEARGLGRTAQKCAINVDDWLMPGEGSCPAEYYYSLFI
jgi:hypothetical protein